MKMSRVVLVLGFVLIMGLYSDAMPEDAPHITDCCFEFFTGVIPPEKILKVKKTDPRCPQQGFLVTTPKFPGGLCVHEVNERNTGTRYEMNIDECKSNPCVNDGICRDLVNGFTCTCKPGFTGIMCQIDIDECASTPCQNGAKCIDRPNGYKCHCAEGFTGMMCQIDIDECASTPCQNGAKCIDRPNGYKCHCSEGMVGCAIRSSDVSTMSPTLDKESKLQPYNFCTQ